MPVASAGHAVPISRADHVLPVVQLDDLSIMFAASNGAITQGAFNPGTWYMPGTDIFGQMHNWEVGPASGMVRATLGIG